MNERIKELLIEAGVYECDVNDPEFVVPEEQKKFAELMVKECADVIQKEVSMKYARSNCDEVDTEEFMGGHYAGSLLARVKIKRHFGFEE